MMNNYLLNNDVREVSRDSTTSDGAANGRDSRTSALSLYQQVTGPTMVSVATMTATNPADPYNPTFFYGLMTTLSNNSRTIALLLNTNDRLSVMIVTKEQEIATLSASNHSLANVVYAYLQESSQRDEVELTHLLVIDELEVNVDKLTEANKQQEQEIWSLNATKTYLLNGYEELSSKNDKLEFKNNKSTKLNNELKEDAALLEKQIIVLYRDKKKLRRELLFKTDLLEVKTKAAIASKDKILSLEESNSLHRKNVFSLKAQRCLLLMRIGDLKFDNFRLRLSETVLRRRIISLEASVLALRNENGTLTTDRDRFQRDYNTYLNDYLELVESSDKTKKRLEQKIEELESSKATLESDLLTSREEKQKKEVELEEFKKKSDLDLQDIKEMVESGNYLGLKTKLNIKNNDDGLTMTKADVAPFANETMAVY